MRLTRLYTPQPLASGATVTLDPRAAGHCARVLRMRAGDAIVLFNGEGGEYQARLETVNRREVRAEVGRFDAVSRESSLRVTLYQALARGERMDYALQKAVELGVAAVVPVLTRRCVVQLDAQKRERRMAHWAGVVTSACEQSGRTRLPALHPPMTLAQVLETGGGNDTQLRLVLDPEAQEGLSQLANNSDEVDLLIGPEGGLDTAEIAACRAAGFTPLRFGPRVLRTETAGAAVIAALQSRWGDLDH